VSHFSITAWIVIASAIGYLVWLVYVLTLVVRSAAFTRRQKLVQCVFATIFPVIGLTVVHWFVTVGTSNPPAPDKDFIRQDIPAPGATKVNW
jgi:hypothetical protein